MSIAHKNIETLRDIRSMMERSSRFISLSGWSGIFAGVFALAGAWIAGRKIAEYNAVNDPATACISCLSNDLTIIALAVFIAAFVSAVLFTAYRSRKDGVAFWGPVSRRLLWNTMMPMLVGGLVIWRMAEQGYYDFIAPSMLIFYGLALINGSKYTMGEIRFLGYSEIVVGITSLFFLPAGLYFWAIGFGVLHIIYGIAMWWKHERNAAQERA